MSGWTRFAGALALAVVLSSTTAVGAQDVGGGSSTTEEEARALFVAGRTAFDAGRYEEAVERFDRSYELSPRPQLLYNIAVAYDRLRRDDQALAAYERYREEPTITDDERRTITGRIDALRRAIEERRIAEEERRREDERARVAPDPTPEPDDDGEGIATKWWLWAIVGVVVAGGATAAILVATSGGGVEQPIAGDHGVVVMTLLGGR